jgi:pyruvate ferredoxin oxidoreductase alpha subunit
VIDPYRADDAETVFVAMGTMVGTLRDWVDAKRAAGEKVGAVKLRCFRPFPAEELVQAVSGAKQVVVLEKAVSMGSHGIVATELRNALYGQPKMPPVAGAVLGLGGRDVTMTALDHAKQRAEAGERDFFADLRTEVLEGY